MAESIRLAVLSCFNCQHHEGTQCRLYDEQIDSEIVAARHCPSFTAVDYCAAERLVGGTTMQCIREEHLDDRHWFAIDDTREEEA